MAIFLKCSKCQKQLEVDNAFAGGVCRCVHCGALSHVPLQPTAVDKKGRPTIPPPMAKPVTASPEEHEQLVIAPTRAHVTAKKRQGLLGIVMMLFAIGMAVGAFYMGKKLGFFGTGGQTTDGTSGKGAPGGGGAQGGSGAQGGGGSESTEPGSSGRRQNPILDMKEPNLLGVKLGGEPVGYLLDVSNSMTDYLDQARHAIRFSAAGLGKGRYVVVPWVLGAAPSEPPAIFPDQGLSSGDSKEDADKLRERLPRFSQIEARDVADAVEEAVQRGATRLVLILHNDLDVDDARAIQAKLQGKAVSVQAVVLDPQQTTYEQLVKLVGSEANLQKVSNQNLLRWTKEALEKEEANQ